jgi:hypothetical protein
MESNCIVQRKSEKNPVDVIYGTDISYQEDFQKICKSLMKHPLVLRVNIDHHDIDNVLRIEASSDISDWIAMAVRQHGFKCFELPG